MAVTRIWPVKGQAVKAIDYAMNPEKTEIKSEDKTSEQTMEDGYARSLV